ncbi:MAG: L-aspartate oxidase [Gemmatimonadetes bacterium]|nr:L-aspartate oxidase [Gemmatimonadota bacterium]
MRIESDYLIVGSGAAGLYFAILTAQSGASVTVVTKSGAGESNTRYAQGGIAAALGSDDSVAFHIQDTLDAGDGLCNRQAVQTAITDGPRVVEDLLQLGTQLSRTAAGELSLGREGGHTRHRVAHADDWTGREISRSLVAAAKAQEGIRLVAGAPVVDLAIDSKGRCRGAWALDGPTAEPLALEARATLLATGGAGQMYSSTTNPAVATGDGLAMAYRSGAILANMEFVQFHPTALAHEQGNTFLITEALRGHGAILVNDEGEPFLERQLHGGSLATRDRVARAIVAELKRSGRRHVYLDVTAQDADETRRRFPNIDRTCREFGIDMTRDRIPVAPAAHYLCGGIHTDLDGRTNVPGLYAAGEAAHTGFHGANRLASNSLLEALVFARRAAEAVADECVDAGIRWPTLPQRRQAAAEVPDRWRTEIGDTMLALVGIERDDAGLKKACHRLDELADEIEAARDDASLEMRNLVTAAQLVANTARMRTESRGVHYNTDHPKRDDETWQHDSLIQLAR